MIKIATRVLETVLDRRYKPESTQLFGPPPFRLMTAAELRTILSQAADLVLQDDMLVEVSYERQLYFER